MSPTFRARLFLAICPLLATIFLSAHGDKNGPLTVQEALKLLNDSPWARQQTSTRVVGGIGSGIEGEKEIFRRFFVRLLSAPPIREAYARVAGNFYETSGPPPEEKELRKRQTEQALKLDMSEWIVVAVTFRSNDAELEQRVKRALQSETTPTMKTRAYLSTERFPQLELAAFYPAIEDSVGAKFVFPRNVNGIPVVSADDRSFAFELSRSGRIPELRVTFSVRQMVIDGILVL